MEPTITRRPWYLSTVLILGALYFLFNAIMLVTVPQSIEEQLFGAVFPRWYEMSTLLVLLASIVGTIAIFKWKKWGLYLAAIVAVVSIALDYSAFPQTITGVVLTLLPAAIFYLCMRPVWSSFK
jgi:hypothetical protein